MNLNPQPEDMARWRKLLRNPYFTKRPDLPPSPRKRQLAAESTLEEERLQKKWAGTTPQGREIIRKKLHALKKRLALENSQLAQVDPPGAPGIGPSK
jgi:hypothetical protein